MFKSLTAKHSELIGDGTKSIIQFYKINDTDFSRIFSTTFIMDIYGNSDDVGHIDQMLENIYHVYKFSKQPVCQNFKRILKITFPHAHSQIIKTNFYKNHKKLIDNSSQGNKNVIKY